MASSVRWEIWVWKGSIHGDKSFKNFGYSGLFGRQEIEGFLRTQFSFDRSKILDFRLYDFLLSVILFF